MQRLTVLAFCEVVPVALAGLTERCDRRHAAVSGVQCDRRLWDDDHRDSGLAHPMGKIDIGAILGQVNLVVKPNGFEDLARHQHGSSMHFTGRKGALRQGRYWGAAAVQIAARPDGQAGGDWFPAAACPPDTIGRILLDHQRRGDLGRRLLSNGQQAGHGIRLDAHVGIEQQHVVTAGLQTVTDAQVGRAAPPQIAIAAQNSHLRKGLRHHLGNTIAAAIVDHHRQQIDARAGQQRGQAGARLLAAVEHR